ncbi:MAG: inosine/xanthosine triphosphatase [Candidatus Jordarchaeales archaeon]|nr:inosine/xanthosine triphosphatase [Candidatus Jordarchaeia archaeon]
MLVVAVGSENPVKVDAVKRVMHKLMGSIKVIPVKVDPGIPKQPIGIEQTLEGAINRAKNALNQTNANLGVGIEAGLISVPSTKTGYMDFQYCAIIDREGWLTVGCGPGFEYPPQVITRVLEEKLEVGEAMSRMTGIENLGRKQGAIGYLTHGIMNRRRLTEISVLMAMIPRINRQLYFSKF